MKESTELITNIATLVGSLVIVAAIIVGVAILYAYPVKWLWNDTLPGMFGLPILSTFKAWEILVLTGMLFRSTNTSKSK
jgi:hypothetical protein